MTRMLIGVCGGTGSGKSTIARKLIEAVGSEQVVLLQQDHYYHDLGNVPLEHRHHINFDHPDALDFPLMIEHVNSLLAGSGIDQPVYDFATHTRSGAYQHIAARPVIIIDGILILWQPVLCELMSLKIFVDTDADLRFIRRLQRDISERGRTPESIINQYLTTVRPMHMELVEPSRRVADIIIPEGGDNHIAIELIAAWIRSQLEKRS